jgi:glycosyltransferase involved in cell wall biosynthesis
MEGERDISIIISTYNQPEWLEKVLWGYETQSYKDFELIIADDGSGDETRELISKFQKRNTLCIHHVWHADNGFQKTAILNKAILQSSSPYLLFSDGDCIPRKDFVEVHAKGRKRGRYISGGYFLLPISTSKQITKQDIQSQNIFQKKWLYNNGVKKTSKMLKLTSSEPFGNFLNALTPTKPTWNGHNSSGWKDDILRVNGFDERMQYGGEDCELGDRLVNLGIKPIQLRYSAICVHLDHSRNYKNEESLVVNKNIRKTTQNNKVKYTHFGIKKD